MKILEDNGDFFTDPKITKIAEFALLTCNHAHSGKGIVKKLAEVSFIYFQ